METDENPDSTLVIDKEHWQEIRIQILNVLQAHSIIHHDTHIHTGTHLQFERVPVD